MSSLSALADAMAMLDADDQARVAAARAARDAARSSARDAERAVADQQVERQRVALLSAQQLLEQRAAGRVWFKGLLPHQWDGMRFGYTAKRWLLGDGMGLGKTRTMIGWTDLIDAKRSVVICQAEIAPQFADEFRQQAPHRRVTLLAKQTPAKRRALLQVAKYHDGILVVNFEMFRKDKQSLAEIIAWRPDTVIVDEAHNLKSTASANYLLTEQIIMADNTCGACGALMAAGVRDGRKLLPCDACGWRVGDAPTPILPAERYFQTKSVKHLGLTTGTPILNSPEDLYPLLHLIDPLRFAFKKAFTETFCEPNYALGGRLEFLAHGLDQLRPMIAGSYLARQRADAGIVLPPQKTTIVKVPIEAGSHPDQARVVQQISEFAKITLEKSGKEHTIMHAMSWLMRKRQSVVWPAGIEIKDTDPNSPNFGEVIFRVGDEVQESAKIDALCANIAIEHAKGARQIVFSQFKTALVAVENRLRDAGYNVARFDGDTKPAERDAIKADFYRPVGTPRFDIVLVHYRSGGTGLNLQQATVTHFLDEEWNPGRAEQAKARTYRMGQTQETEVFVYRSTGKGAQIDQFMANLQALKQRTIDQFDDTMVNDTTDLLEELNRMIVEDVA